MSTQSIMNFQKFVFAIVFFCNLLLQAKATLFNSSDGLLKSSLATCTYSIVLYDRFTDAWDGNTATVKIDNVDVLTNITYTSGTKSNYFNFTVTDLSSITVIYNPTGGYQWENNYAINSGVDGTGSNVYSSFPFFHTLTNPCTSACTYSAAYYYNYNNRMKNSFAIYINKKMVQNISLSSTEDFKIVNFNVAKDDLIQFSMFFNYQGGRPNYYYIIYDAPDATGSSLYSSFNFQSQPATPVSVSNYCSKSLYLSLSSTATNTTLYYAPTIPLAVLPSVMTNFPMQINLTLVCGSNSTSQTRLSSDNSTDTVDFPIPDSYYGLCYFIAQSVDYLVPEFENSAQFWIQIQKLKSPFGGDLTPITPEETQIFTSEIAVSPSIWFSPVQLTVPND